MFSDDYIARVVDETGIPEAELRIVLADMEARGMLVADSDGEAVPVGELADFVAEAQRELTLFLREMHKPALILLNDEETCLADGVEPLDGALRVERPRAHPGLN